jgi:hypothetical protein
MSEGCITHEENTNAHTILEYLKEGFKLENLRVNGRIILI